MFELSNLAKSFFESHKFNWETCCIVGNKSKYFIKLYCLANYYSINKKPELAIDFLKRAVKICPKNASIWVLLGHELMETRNHSAAVTAYRKATGLFLFNKLFLVIDPLCYRGWYGLGLLYEVLKLPAYALNYYQHAHKCR